ncbi:MAG: universal stress protein [Nocardioides sp.]|jgi:nucleotide-binding universal stress UspA family protein
MDTDTKPTGAVVAGIDGTELDLLILTAAVAESLTRKAPLHVRHCRELLDPNLAIVSAGGWPVTVEDSDGGVLEAARQTVATLAPELDATYDSPAGRPENLLVDASETAALVVVGTGRKSRLEELLLGTVALNVAAHATCPVLVVPPGSDADAKGDIAVGVDGSDHSRAAVEEAVRVARARAAKLVVVSTWNHELIDGYVVTEPDSPEWRAVEERITAMQERVLSGIDTSGVEVELRSVKGGIRTTLSTLSDDTAMLVVGNRGRGGFKSKALGSVTRDLLKRSSCPVMVVHAPRG